MNTDDFLPSFINQPPKNILQRLCQAIKACIGAGELITKIRDEGLSHTTKGALDTVTQADLASEKFIQQSLASSFPQDTFYGEEFQQSYSPENVWVIDPIDGTVNFASGSHYWCISLAWVVNNACKIGIIYAPDMRKMFIGVDGFGSFCNKLPLHIQKLEASQQVIIGVGTSARTSFEGYLQTLSLLQQQGFEHRRLGAGALMLAEVAAGSLQGYFEPHMNSWDALAGLLLVREAGGSHFNFLASEENIKTGNRVFAASRIISESLSFLLAEIK